MGITVKEYARQQGINQADAEFILRKKVEDGLFRRHRSAGLPWIYEPVLPIQFNDPFNLGAAHAKRRRPAGPNMQYKYRTDA
jgi:hypothetical protein